MFPLGEAFTGIAIILIAGTMYYGAGRHLLAVACVISVLCDILIMQLFRE